jgi:protein gp37
MADHSGIEWTDATWNPVRGCTKVSPGCAHCYAETFAERFRGVKGHPYEQGFDLRLVPEKLAEPLSWKKPRRVFVNSMSDLFQDGVPDDYVAEVWKTMATIRRHTYQVLTKRSERMWALVPRLVSTFGVLPNVWLGVSVENRRFKSRIGALRDTPAAVHFLSIEPLLEDISTLNLRGIQWVIVGGESGPGARPFDMEWARSIIAQCKAANVACFVKQLGAHAFEGEPENGGGGPLYGLRDRKGGDPSEWPADLRLRQYPE